MAFALKILRIQVYNTYYKHQISHDFAIVPDTATQHLMERYAMKCLFYPGCVDVIWRAAHIDNPLHIWRAKMQDMTWSFYMHIKNPLVVNYTELDVEQSELYYFHNAHGGQALHAQPYVSPADKIITKQLPHYIDQPGEKKWGCIDIQLNKLWESSDFVENKLPITYTITMQARETIWRYCVIDNQQRIKYPMKIVYNGNDSYFSAGFLKKPNQWLYQSKSPLMLRDQPDSFFSLQTVSQAGVADQTIIEKLPLPLADSLRKEHSQLFNDIVVYV